MVLPRNVSPMWSSVQSCACPRESPQAPCSPLAEVSQVPRSANLACSCPAPDSHCVGRSAVWSGGCLPSKSGCSSLEVSPALCAPAPSCGSLPSFVQPPLQVVSLSPGICADFRLHSSTPTQTSLSNPLPPMRGLPCSGSHSC